MTFFTGMIGSGIIILVLSAVVMGNPGGSPAGYSGSPGDAKNCKTCHGGTTANVSGWITSNIPAAGYTPGTVYNITATVTGSGKKGFQVSPQNGTGTQLGILTAGSNNHLVGGTKYVTQNSSGSSSGTSTYNFTWTAPAAGTGAVTFYGAFIVGYSNTKLSTLAVAENTAVPLTAVANATPPVICAGQNSQLTVEASGGSGTYTYSWTSIPSGFTSSQQSPVVTPSVSTQYIAHVSDGSVSVDAPTNVTVNPPATADAGNDTTCSKAATQVPLNGTAASYSAVLWTTTGTGTFSAAAALSGYYYPGTEDLTGGTVTLTLTASSLPPCTSAATDSRIVHFEWPTGGTDAPGSQIGMTISPNPSSGFFRLRISGLDNHDATVTVSDIRGIPVLRHLMEGSGTHSEQFDISGSPKGLYLVKILAGNETMVRKLVIE